MACSPFSLLMSQTRYPLRNARVLVAMTESSRERFFPQGLVNLPANIECLLLDEIPSEGDWETLLKEWKPDVVMGDWEMPSISARIVQECPGLGYVCYVTGSIRKRVDRTFLEQGGVVSNWGSSIAPSVAECALMLALMGLRQATRFSLEMHVDKGWRVAEGPAPLGLFRRKVGFYGFGAVARALLKLLAPFDVSVEAHSEGVPRTLFDDHGVKMAESLESLFSQNEVVFVMEGLHAKSRGSVGEAVLSGMQPGSVLVNVARGAIIDEAALERLALQGRVQIGLDVFATEPLPDHSPLRGLRNVALLPHTAGPTIDWYPVCGERALHNLGTWLAGEVPTDSVSLEKYDAST